MNVIVRWQSKRYSGTALLLIANYKYLTANSQVKTTGVDQGSRQQRGQKQMQEYENILMETEDREQSSKQ